MKTNTRRILRFLEKNAGSTIHRKELDKQLTSNFKPKRSHKRSRSSRHDNNLTDPAQDPDTILTELQMLGLVEGREKKIKIAKPFTVNAKASQSRGGLIFAMPRISDREAEDIFVPPENSAGARHGDIITVRLLDKSRSRFEGEIIRIEKRARRFFRMRLNGESDQKYAYGILLDSPGEPAGCISVRGMSADTRDRLRKDSIIIVTLTGETVQSGGEKEEGVFVRFEDDTNFDTDFARILMKYDLDPVYPDSGQEGEFDKEINEKTITDWKKRKDLRNLYTITIDGAESKDFDDALSLKTEKDTWTLYVHIADVSYYVHKGTPLDKEAQNRATSYYLANRVVPMLPPLLSENLCSLVPNEDRLAFTAEMKINRSTGKIVKSLFYKSVIRSDYRYTYAIAEEVLDGKRKDPVLNELWELAQLQRKDRMKTGKIDLTIPEPKYVYGKDDSVKKIEFKERLKSSILIEECMLSANTATAAFLKKKNAVTLYRVHEPMEEEKLDALNRFLEIYNIPVTLKSTDGREIQSVLEQVSEKGPLETRVFNLLLLRSFMQASYRPEPAGHWGLGFDDYCHFTSPIRRYPDLIVHRTLERLLDKKKSVYSEDEMEMLAVHTSEKERHAMDAERDMAKLKLVRYVEESNQREFTGFITGFRSDRVFVELDECPVEGVIEYSELTNERELDTSDRFSFYVKKLSRPAFLGERWKLKLDRIDLENIRLYFKPLWGNEQRALGPESDSYTSPVKKKNQAANRKQRRSKAPKSRQKSGKKPKRR